jgi:hypothetical protein
MAYEFKVCDKGNTCDGKKEYEILAISDNMHDKQNVIAKIRSIGRTEWGITCRDMNGTTRIERINYHNPTLDFMPPTVKVWRVTATEPKPEYKEAVHPRPVPTRIVAEYPDITPAWGFAASYEAWFGNVIIEQVEVEKL